MHDECVDSSEVVRRQGDVNACTTAADVAGSAPGVSARKSSVMPRGKKYIDTILSINNHYRDIAAEFNAQYLDLWPALATPENTLRKDLTPDGLNMNGSGYREWMRILQPAPEEAVQGLADNS
jgi:lysophospholipase L1-like esterase